MRDRNNSQTGGGRSSQEGRRVTRVEKEIQQVIASYLINGFSEKLPGLVTVASVKMPGDLRTARVFVSVLGEEPLLQNVLEILQARAFEIQKFIGHELKMRYCPKLTFEADTTTSQVLKIEKILSELKKDPEE